MGLDIRSHCAEQGLNLERVEIMNSRPLLERLNELGSREIDGSGSEIK